MFVSLCDVGRFLGVMNMHVLFINGWMWVDVWGLGCVWRNTGLDETQAGMKIAGRNINNLRYTDDTTLMAESEEELKSLLMKVKEGSE